MSAFWRDGLGTELTFLFCFVALLLGPVASEVSAVMAGSDNDFGLGCRGSQADPPSGISNELIFGSRPYLLLAIVKKKCDVGRILAEI
jgi:hypothetical protein